MAQWIPLHGLSVNDYRSVLKTFSSVFGHTRLYLANAYSIIIGSRQPILLKPGRLDHWMKRSGRIRKELEEILKLSETSSSEKLIEFLKVLEILSKEEHYKLLCSSSYTLPIQVTGENRLQKVINHIFDNYSRNVTLEEIAEIAIMTPTAFCRFFKTRTNKTFSHFLNEVRVSKACQLLISEERSIKQVCYDVGFNSLTNFNRTFRSFKGATPSHYRSKYQELRI